MDNVQSAERCWGGTGPWKVTLRWVLDSEKYNEWMNPVDYETDEALAEQEKLGLVIEAGEQAIDVPFLILVSHVPSSLYNLESTSEPPECS